MAWLGTWPEPSMGVVTKASLPPKLPSGICNTAERTQGSV